MAQARAQPNNVCGMSGISRASVKLIAITPIVLALGFCPSVISSSFISCWEQSRGCASREIGLLRRALVVNVLKCTAGYITGKEQHLLSIQIFCISSGKIRIIEGVIGIKWRQNEWGKTIFLTWTVFLKWPEVYSMKMFSADMREMTPSECWQYLPAAHYEVWPGVNGTWEWITDAQWYLVSHNELLRTQTKHVKPHVSILVDRLDSWLRCF